MANDSAGKKRRLEKKMTFPRTRPLFFSDRIWGKRGAGAESSIYIHVTGEPFVYTTIIRQQGVSENVKPREKKGK